MPLSLVDQIACGVMVRSLMVADPLWRVAVSSGFFDAVVVAGWLDRSG
jgi:hypothetical protein